MDQQNQFPGGALHGRNHEPRASIIFPMMRHWRELNDKTPLIRFSLTIVIGLTVWLLQSSLLGANLGLAIFVGAAIAVFTCESIYRLCGRPIPVPFRVVSMVGMTISIVVFTALVVAFNRWLIASFGFSEAFAAGVSEELFKVSEVIAVLLLSHVIRRTAPNFALHSEVPEPLECIYLGVVAGATFAFVESLIYFEQEGTNGILGRNAASIALHSAAAGLFGYFVGLAFQARKYAALYLGIGFAVAAGLHGLWDVLAFARMNRVIPFLGIFNYAFLGAAILKARKLSPTRRQNFATTTLSEVLPAAPPVEQPVPAPVAPIQHEGAVNLADGQAAKRASVLLRLPSREIVLKAGLELWVSEIPGLSARDNAGIIAAVQHRNEGSDAIGLANLSCQTWRVTSAKGTRDVAPGQVIAIRTGTTIDFGLASGVFDTH